MIIKGCNFLIIFIKTLRPGGRKIEYKVCGGYYILKGETISGSEGSQVVPSHPPDKG
jgi:hypothetical protein